jgi:DNA-binding transcriptional MerR regulator
MDIDEMLDKLDDIENISLEDIPSIDLYMDQVIQLFEKTFGPTKRNDEEKILTKTMINNYAKGKLFFPVKNKKYSKEHIILIALIYQLKGVLSIGDIKTVLNGINEKLLLDEIDLEQFYKSYLNIHQNNLDSYKENLKEKAIEANAELAQMEGDTNELEKVLLIASLVNMSNLYRKTAEKLVDTLKE